MCFRGVAVLGILAVNIFMLAQPSVMFMVPKALGDPGTLDMIIWTVVHIVFYQKFLAIFSMLFGAGLILMAGRAEAAGRSFRGVWYRRLLWLLADRFDPRLFHLVGRHPVLVCDLRPGALPAAELVTATPDHCRVAGLFRRGSNLAGNELRHRVYPHSSRRSQCGRRTG